MNNDHQVLQAQVDSSMRSEIALKIRRGVDRLVQSGQYPGRAPVGYYNTRGGIRLNPKTAPLLRQAFALMEAGVPLPEVLGTISKQGLRTRTGKLLTRWDLLRLFANPIYRGTFLWKGKHYAGTHTPLIKAGSVPQSPLGSTKQSSDDQPLKVVAYLRAKGGVGLPKTGLANQCVEIAKAAQELGIVVSSTFIEYGSVQNSDQAVYDKLLRLAEHGKISGIIYVDATWLSLDMQTALKELKMVDRGMVTLLLPSANCTDDYSLPAHGNQPAEA